MNRAESLIMFHALSIVKATCGNTRNCSGCPARNNDNICGVNVEEAGRIPENWDVVDVGEWACDES